MSSLRDAEGVGRVWVSAALLRGDVGRVPPRSRPRRHRVAHGPSRKQLINAMIDVSTMHSTVPPSAMVDA